MNMVGIPGMTTPSEERSLAIIREPAFKAACEQQRLVAEQIERLQAELLRMSDLVHREPRNWGIHGSLAHVRQGLETLVRFLGDGDD